MFVVIALVLVFPAAAFTIAAAVGARFVDLTGRCTFGLRFTIGQCPQGVDAWFGDRFAQVDLAHYGASVLGLIRGKQ